MASATPSPPSRLVLRSVYADRFIVAPKIKTRSQIALRACCSLKLGRLNQLERTQSPVTHLTQQFHIFI